ncbi:MAG TPA: redoxin domain-containing protein [Urbifossiella sp.]
MNLNRHGATAFAGLLLFAAGCGSTAAVPQIDYTNTDGYHTAEFKDDAQANTQISSGEFPLAFVDAEGNPVDLTRFRGHQKVVLVVLRGMPQQYKGSFCPTCLAQAGSLMANKEEFVKRQAEVLVVFPGPSERVGEFLRKAKVHTPGEPDTAFRVLLDKECTACSQLGIRDDLAKPSTYILDTHGNVVFAYVGETSTDRPSVKAILAQLDKAE